MLVNPKADGWSSALEKRLAASGSLMFRGGLREGCSKMEKPFSFDVAQSDFDTQGFTGRNSEQMGFSQGGIGCTLIWASRLHEKIK